MLKLFLVLYSLAYSAPLCTIKVEMERSNQKPLIQTYKFKNQSSKQCKIRARQIDNRPAGRNVYFKFVSWEWRGKKS